MNEYFLVRFYFINVDTTVLNFATIAFDGSNFYGSIVFDGESAAFPVVVCAVRLVIRIKIFCSFDWNWNKKVFYFSKFSVRWDKQIKTPRIVYKKIRLSQKNVFITIVIKFFKLKRFYLFTIP
ncbi:Hypothetical protein LBL_2539 [Leptospira borgpetersenii serovar Hardjo-bovis str. L550]|uniref:Uncharacterized protein n=1 Tax=Leptospira borgpetersenii serovar Hardjo-bovis (strain JB197) TaxID=355277 RepID=Q04V35_LEPBJ|nr:Hypothetical protein LBJ_0540 [Leptospira borgpetersenii serovar Hardjo-bovis str. JB197]ABJ79903.1 Hypothetical protein LBL_2539 [Leptospira borgpetersenii serovar Hardjo-bovis str. L550]AMX59314.1 hypothetical protein LBK6_13575 [Leptospira borgpetersenii serovar Hardjo]AMX62543.1 hypothetical protein LBK9_13490 [Leptospira borgpetersenii serovar Hardjo]AMX65785.1 hypothetical protein LBK30_13505 [Leptospira borgpetersenii serovar Hardjo]